MTHVKSKRSYKVFVSSTYMDNKERRKIVRDAITMAGMMWHGMEVFTASTRPTVEECIRLVGEADVMVGIIAWRYGWIPEGEEKSITELEYDAAKERLMFQIDPSLPVNPETDFDPGPDKWKKQEKLAAFKNRFYNNMAASFKDNNLSGIVLGSLNNWREQKEVSQNFVPDVISSTLKLAADKASKSLSRKEKVQKILTSAGLESGPPAPDFESVYAHALVEYGVQNPHEADLDVFNRASIRSTFEKSFENNDRSILNHEAAAILNWDYTKKERLEFARFTLIFHEIADRTRAPAEAGREEKLDEILRIAKEGDINAIRAKTVEMIQGTLAENLKSWFKIQGYSIRSLDVQRGDYCEWIITNPDRRVLVRCIEKQAEIEDLEGVESGVKQHKVDEGWLVADLRISLSARKMAEKDDSLFCYTFDELLDEQADFSKYFKWLESYAKERAIGEDYIPLACRRDIYDRTSGKKTGEERCGEAEGWIEGCIDRWLEAPCKDHITILGEFGTGKTWFTHHYAFQLMQKYKEAKEKGMKRPRLPLVIQLRDYSKALHMESLISGFFFPMHEIPLAGYSAFEQLNRMGKLLLIFDGFDEMADKLDHQKMIDNFLEIARVVVPGAKAILTCRTEHFPSAREGRNLLKAKLKNSADNLTGDSPQFEVLDLERFDEVQIRIALSRRTDQGTIDLIMSHPGLLDLASRPVMLEFILEALPDIEGGGRVDLARIYLSSIRAKLGRDIKSGRTFTSMADKLYFMCELSWEMFTTDKMSLNHRLFPERLVNQFGSLVSEEKDLDHWRYDMMSNTLLVRNDDGDYSPAHRSLAEFFVAYKALALLGMLPSDFIEPARSQSNIDQHLKSRDYTWSAYFTREKNEDGSIRKIPPLDAFAPENINEALGLISGQGDAVLRFIYEMTNVDEVRLGFHKLLSNVLEDFKQNARDPERQQDIHRFILKFIRMSQKWEKQADQDGFIRHFWKKYHKKEIGDVQHKATSETMRLEIPGDAPIAIDMIKVPAGSFLMGDGGSGPMHRVRMEKPFLMAGVPVTQNLYRAVTGKKGGCFEDEEALVEKVSWFRAVKCGRFEEDQAPVEQVSWFEAVRFCNTLSKRMNLEPAYIIDREKVEWLRNRSGFRLPTAAEWEYACRAGSTTRFSSGDLETDLNKMGWWKENSGGHTHPVGLKNPNAWGLFDMYGNVCEWGWDWRGRPSGGRVDSPTATFEDALRVKCGGSWSRDAHACRSSARAYSRPDFRLLNLGFRLSRSFELA